jgi:glycosyltransferase involved in cell wall biosynthesis
MDKDLAFIILTPGFAASESDSTCLPMQQHFVKTLGALHPHIDIIILSFQYPYEEKTYQWCGCTVISFNGQNKGGLKKLLTRQKVNKTLTEIQSKKKIIGLLSFWLGECALVGQKFGAKKNIKHRCWLLGQDARPGNSYVKTINPSADSLFALSEFLQEEFYRNYGIRPANVVFPGMQAMVTNETARNIDIIGIGSLIALKQFEIFVETVAGLRKEFPLIKAYLVGSGPEKARLEQLVEQFGMSPNIVLTGELPYDQVLKLLQRSKILLHPSRYEGFSGVCMEALAAGAHVISFCRAMNKEVDQWHIVNTKEEMLQKATELLSKPLSNKPVSIRSMEDTVRQMLDLFK